MATPEPHQAPPQPKTKFTPLKVRGKRGASNQPPQPTKHCLEYILSETADPASNPKRRRRIKPRRAGSALIERLPLEVLEQIFLLSKNLNFPRSSLYIGRILSERVTLLRLVVEAFGPTWDLWFGCVPGTVCSYYGWERDGKRFGGDPKFQVGIQTSFFWYRMGVVIDGALQTNVLACRQVDVSVLLDAQKLWLRRQTGPRFLAMLSCPLKSFFSETVPPVDRHKPATGEDIDRCFEWEWKCHGAWCEALVYAANPRQVRLVNGVHTASEADRLPQYRRTPYLYALSKLLTRTVQEYDFNGNPMHRPPCVYSMPSSIDMHCSVQIPDELLAGPWDWAKAKLLFWLVRQGAKLASEQTWEVGVPSQSDDALKLTRWYS